jgi:hypothetical protein
MGPGIYKPSDHQEPQLGKFVASADAAAIKIAGILDNRQKADDPPRPDTTALCLKFLSQYHAIYQLVPHDEKRRCDLEEVYAHTHSDSLFTHVYVMTGCDHLITPWGISFEMGPAPTTDHAGGLQSLDLSDVVDRGFSDGKAENVEMVKKWLNQLGTDGEDDERSPRTAPGL